MSVHALLGVDVMLKDADGDTPLHVNHDMKRMMQ